MRGTDPPLVGFFRGTVRDQSGRTLADVLAFDDAQLEQVHDYIQWLFPLLEPSAFNPAAPILDEGQIHAFRTSPELRQTLLAALDRMLDFYGLVRVSDGSQDRVRLGPRFELRKSEWLTPRNHNFLRLTRILTSLRLLGLESQSAALFACLREIYAGDEAVIGRRTFEFWLRAATAGE